MVDMCIPAWKGGVNSREEKVSLHGGSLGGVSVCRIVDFLSSEPRAQLMYWRQ
jgi:hypothetical protein